MAAKSLYIIAQGLGIVYGGRLLRSRCRRAPVLGLLMILNITGLR